MMNEQGEQYQTESDTANAHFPIQARVHTGTIEPMPNAQIPPTPRRGLWVRWVPASAIFGLGPVAGVLLTWIVGLSTPTEELKVQPDAFWGAVFVFFIGLALLGMVAALAQWAVLHPYLPEIKRFDWVRTVSLGYLGAGFFCVAGLIAAPAVIYVYSGFLTFVYGRYHTGPERELDTAFIVLGVALFIMGVVASTIIGWAQWAALHRYVPNAKRLILSNMIAAGVFQLSVLLVAYVIAGESSVIGEPLWETVVLGWIATLFLSGMITGFTLVRLLRRSSR